MHPPRVKNHGKATDERSLQGGLLLSHCVPSCPLLGEAAPSRHTINATDFAPWVLKRECFGTLMAENLQWTLPAFILCSLYSLVSLYSTLAGVSA